MFDTAAKISLSKITNLAMFDLNEHLVRNSSIIDSATEAAVISLISQYDALPADEGLEIFPTESNFGAKISNLRGNSEQTIVRQIRSLLNIESSSGSVRLVRC